ncbi:MAG: hypothetical protein ABIG63_19025 [Chloroflexota bacterium]
MPILYIHFIDTSRGDHQPFLGIIDTLDKVSNGSTGSAATHPPLIRYGISPIIPLPILRYSATVRCQPPVPLRGPLSATTMGKTRSYF